MAVRTMSSDAHNRNITERYFHGKYFYAKTMLAAGPANLLINGISQPVSLFLTGNPSSKKSTVLELLRTLPQTVWSDSFSPASFVSGARNMEEADLLPRLRNRCLITPELSTLFSGKNLPETLGILTRVLDGRGYVRHTGFGQVGYADAIRMNWLAAIVNVPDRVWKILGHLGHRLLFLHIDDEIETFAAMEHRMDHMLTEGRNYEQKLSIVRTSNVANLLSISERYPDGIDWNTNADSRTAKCTIAKAAITLRAMRGTIDPTLPTPIFEEPTRLTESFYNISRGNAVLGDRIHVTMGDVEPIVAIMADSAPVLRRDLLLSLLDHKGELDTNEYIEISKLSRKTVLEKFTEMKTLGIIEYAKNGSSASNNATKKIRLNPEFSWMQNKKILRMLHRPNLL